MRIAIFAWESLHSIAVGGVANHTTELAAALARKEQEIHVFTRRPTGQRAYDQIDGVHYHRCQYPHHSDFVDDVNNMCRVFVDRFFEIEDFVGQFDLIHAQDWLAANALIWIKQGCGHKPGVLTIHSTEYARCGNTFVNGRSIRVRDQERAGTYWADHVIVVSKATRDEIKWMYEVPESKTTVIHNGVNWKQFELDCDPGQVKHQYSIAPLDPMVLFCGRLVWQKGPDILIEAIPSILRKYPDTKFVFAGDGEMRGLLEARVRQLEISHAVRFLGYHNGQELIRLFGVCDVVCVPSRNEPFGIVVLEAWSAGKPVLATENGGPNEFVHHEINGLKIYPRVDSIAWGIDRIFSDFQNARRMGQNGHKELEEQFSWDTIAEQTLEVYHPLITGRNGQEVFAKDFQSQRPHVRKLKRERKIRAVVELEAKLRVPAHAKNENSLAVLESLKNNLTHLGYHTQQKEHYLKIKGDWEHLASALDQCRKNLMIK